MKVDPLGEEVSASGLNPGESASGGAIEAILRQVAALRAATGVDEQLLQLVRLVDSATWSSPVPMTLLVDGTLMRGVLVPSEVSAAFFDDALLRVASRPAAETSQEEVGRQVAEDSETSSPENVLPMEQARAFAKRIGRRLFRTQQVRAREKNANALRVINEWYRARGHDKRLTAFDFPGSYSDPSSSVRDVVNYAIGQRAITLVEVEVMSSSEWVRLPGPVRVGISRIGAWSVEWE